MKHEVWLEWEEEYLAGRMPGPEGTGSPEAAVEETLWARRALDVWLGRDVREAVGEKPDPGRLRQSVEQMLYRLALAGAGCTVLDRYLEELKAFSAWCCTTGKLPFDFAREIPRTGETDPDLAAHIRRQWGLNDRFYGIGEGE